MPHTSLLHCSLYSHRDVFLRELISNANDAIEKLRLTSLTDKSVYDGSHPLNITIKAVKNEDGKGGRIIISDTGIGMTPEELTTNLVSSYNNYCLVLLRAGCGSLGYTGQVRHIRIPRQGGELGQHWLW